MKINKTRARRAVIRGLLLMALPLAGDIIFSLYAGEMRIAYPWLYPLAFIFGVVFA
ncbi:hypothetical protein Q4610_01280 [Sphingobium sp. HBC34]|uniref:Uncharacterized protein n=1 Tax=Sphingobium cyanobacteriorum TaxID=3063954 RepID=A0ABT8ZJE0_9SPHN|nr:hypothetical protein [Sphingobium sp. HBC34]MDO7833666.1 hypothetical protein [Sphingobium sp. HBC34]